MTRYLGRAAQAMLLALVFSLTLLLHLPLGAMAGPLEAALPGGVSLERPDGRLLDGEAQALVIEPATGWPLRLGPVAWHIGLDGGWPRLRLGLGEAWALDARLDGLALDWRLTGGDLAVLDASALPIGATARLGGELGGRLTGRLGPDGCREASGGLSGRALRLSLPEEVALGQARLTLRCENGRDAWRFTLGDPPGSTLALNQSLLGGGGELTAHLGADHPLFAYWRLADPRLRPGEQTRRW